MGKIVGNTTATPMAVPDWLQTDENKADYIKNKPMFKTINGQNIIGDGNIEINGETDKPITIDVELSATSTNPVQNKVITEEINKINEKIKVDDLDLTFFKSIY